MVVRNWEWMWGDVGSMVVVMEVLVNVEGTATGYLTTRKLEVSATADSELPGKDSVRK